MRYETPEAFRAALDQRLRNEAKVSGVPVMRLRKRVAFERLLARITAADPDRLVLKGAFALELRLGLRTRSTRDIDLAGSEDERTATATLLAAQAIDLHDHFQFNVSRTAALDRAEALRAVRYSIVAELAGRVFERFPVDVALGPQQTFQAERLSIPSLLAFADIGAVQIPVIGIEQHTAEKLHAYTATYGPDGQHSTRVKDLVDLLLIAGLTSPQAARLRSSLEATFAGRARQPLPSALPAPPASWRAPYGHAAREVGLSAELHAAHAEAASFLDPVLDLTASGHWRPAQRRWTAS